MPKIQVLGPGCQKCQTLFERTTQAAADLGLACEIEKVSDIQTIVSLGILSTPALVVDGNIKVYGRVPTVAQLKEMLT
jgi:small redox-active disulfide protein 2